MRALFLLGAAWLAYVYVGYPVLLGIVEMLRRVRPRLREDYLPQVSVLIAARNEEKDIGWKIRETLAWDYPHDRLEVLIASDASDDRTDEIVRSTEDDRLTLVRMEQRGGKNLALNRLVPLARGEVLFFTDANAHIEPHALRRVTRHFADPRVGCVTGQAYPLRDEYDSGLSRGAKVYWSYEALVKRLENRIGSVLVCEGPIFCIRRSLFTPLSPDLANDLELPWHVAKLGFWVCYEPRAQASEYETSAPREEFARRRRICAQGMLAAQRLGRTLSPLRGWQFFSRKFLRWFTLIPLLLLLLSSAALSWEPWYRAVLALEVAFYVLAGFGWFQAALGKQTRGPLAVPYYVTLVCAAGLIGAVESCLGRRFATWEIPKMSRRGKEIKWEKAG
jgi:cellulose synthase/poly-beta-1,6-N-acetylglucosamine synthase-like glycosyltransferase